MQNSNKFFVLRIIVDCLLTLLLLIVASNFFKIFGPAVKRGFFCDDESLKYPYHEDTINGIMLYFLSLYFPVFIIAIGESLLILLQRGENSLAQHKRITIHFVKLHLNLTTFLCGFALQALFVHMAKITVGRLRPHFFDVCQPYRRVDGSTCDNPKNHGLYILDYECNSKNVPTISQRMLNGMHQSFPSGHSSYIFYGMIFLILYLQRFSKTLRNYSINVGLFMMAVQMFCALLAWFVAVSRVMDYKHHWSDVLVGIMLGTSVATAVTLYICQQLKSVNSWPEGVKTSNSEATSATNLPQLNQINGILVP